MPLAAGTRLGPYQLADVIGSGAMGVVYRARDTRLGRDVAIKVLPPIFARDPDRLARFEREARAVAAINHPNIVSVHDIGSAEATEDGQTSHITYLITELLDGETLRARLVQGALAPRKAADVAMQVARGLAAAHDRGIVHRDLKPENIVLLRDGHVKILDFGLAKQSGASTGSSDEATIAATDAGTVLGTVGYMAPEQVRGEPADARTDLFALGAVLYELASGKRAFQRATAAETMTAILREDPPELVAGDAPLAAGLGSIVRHALEKDPDERFQSGRDMAFALQTFKDGGTSSGASFTAAGASARRPMRVREIAAWAMAGVFALGAIALWTWPASSGVGAGTPVIFAPVMPLRDGNLGSPSVSPDGTRIAFISYDRSGNSIVMRRLDALATEPVKGTAGARPGGVFWSPDGRSIGFFAGGKVKTIDLASGRIDELADAPAGYGGTWSADGTILFSPDERTPIYRVSAKGGDAKPVTTLDAAAHDEAHRWPQFLPDGRHFIYTPWKLNSTTRTIQLASLDGGKPTPLFDADSEAVVCGHFFIFIRDEGSHLYAQAFNPSTFALEGAPVELVNEDNADYDWPTAEAWLSAGGATLVYTTGKYRLSQLTWYNRAGEAVGTVGDPDVYYDPTVSPDGSAVAVERLDHARGTTDLWTVNLARGAFSRLTSTPGYEDAATWSPDGKRVTFTSDNTGPNILRKDANGGAEEVLVAGRAFPMDWSADGRTLLYMVDGGATRLDIWAYDAERKTSKPLLNSPFEEARARFSPDGKWIAYESDETHEDQIYLRSYPDGATKMQVTSAGGDEPQWRRDGRELYYIAPDTTLMAVALTPKAGGFDVGEPKPLFVTNTITSRVLRNTYSPTSDGQRFLVMTPIVPPTASPLVGVLHWTAGLAGR